MMKQKHRFIFLILIVLFLTSSGTVISSDLPEPGTASGELKVNSQAFYIKHAYVKKTKDSGYLVLLTNRPFREDLSKLDRLDLNKYANRYDIQGVAIGIDEKNQSLSFIDILRLKMITEAVEFKPSSNEEGLIAGKLTTNGEKQFINNKFELDITFSVKP
jgi:hypothetical protein